jgi:hypothetical protein
MTQPNSIAMNMLRRVLLVSMVLTIGFTTVACGGSPSASKSDSSSQPQSTAASQPNQAKLSDGVYPIQQATYNDGDGEYNLMLLDTKPGESSVLRVNNLPMARLTDEEISGGKKSYLKVENGQPSMHLAEDFKIEYVHNVTETATNSQTGQAETVVVRQESSFWSPFAGALAGQALGSLLFTPRYYLPPVYTPGTTVLTGYGGYGSSYDQAVSSYRQKYNSAPAEVKNRQTFRTTGSPASRTSTTTRPSTGSTQRSTGSGFGSSTLRRNPASGSSTYKRPAGSGFGSRTGSFGRRR